ncbi:MAG TPA: hypothetical protein VH437_23810 [Terriglobales bacterium]
MTRRMIAVITLLFVSLAAIPSPAAIKAANSRTNFVIFSDELAHLIPLDNSGATSINFSTTAPNQGVVITYNAECSVAGTDNQTWLDIDIMLDGVIVSPSDSDNAFCTDNGTGALTNWVSAVIVVATKVPLAGPHTVEVRGGLKVFDAGDQFRLDDSTILVTQ